MPRNVRIYLLDGALLGAFMLSACACVALLEHPASPLHAAIASAFTRRAVVGVAMGLTALALVYSPWGKRTGAFMNPALTLCFLRLGKLEPRDALGYCVAQCVGGVLGVGVAELLLGRFVSEPAVRFAVTEPGPLGAGVAWVAELAISFALVSVVMAVNRVPRLAPFGGCFAAVLVALFITFEAPLSGMSMNPARTLASAVFAGSSRHLSVYLTAPVLGMLAAVELELVRRAGKKPCGKLSHDPSVAGFVRCDCVAASNVPRDTNPLGATPS
jgi:aquaporin Z